MLDQVVDFFNIKIDYDLGLMSKSNLSQLSSKILSSLDEIIKKGNLIIFLFMEILQQVRLVQYLLFITK